MDKIKFGDLSWPLKAAVIMSWVVGVIYGISILVAFISELLVV